MPIYGITPLLPLAINPIDGKFASIKTYKNTVKQNFKNLLLTNPGERMMDIDFGVGIKTFLFEMREDVKTSLKAKIYSQAEKYLSYVELIEVEYPGTQTEELYAEDLLNVRVIYEIIPLSSVDVLDIIIER
jgi:phage baseplate assembly protein W